MIRHLIYIGTGGFIGAILRYLISGWIQQNIRSGFFPFGTMGVNMIGCFIIGILGGLVENREFFSPESRLFLLIGILGSFTTFSTFSFETLALIRDQQFFTALLNITGHIFIGILAAWLGYSITH